MKYKLSLLICSLLITFNCCKAQEKYNSMETYNFELTNNSKHNPVGIERNGWTILMYKMGKRGAYYDEYPPAPHFYMIGRMFYPNGNIKAVGKITGRHLPIGEWIYYDELGHITKKIDEDKKFGKVKLNDLLKFIEKEGWINLETGEGREHVIVYEDGKCDIIPSRFSIGHLEENPYWEIRIIAMPYNDFNQTIYHIDKDTGEVLFKESKTVRLTK